MIRISPQNLATLLFLTEESFRYIHRRGHKHILGCILKFLQSPLPITRMPHMNFVMALFLPVILLK